MSKIVLKAFWNICHIDPELGFIREYLDIKDHELMMRDVIDSFEDVLEFFIRVWETATEVFTVE